VAGSSAPTLSVIIPVFNGEGWIGRTLSHLSIAIDRANLAASEVLVMDDGSTDATVDEARSVLESSKVEFAIVSGTNGGRFAARRKGLELAKHDYVLFIDARVFIDPDALRFVCSHLESPTEQVWNAHVRTETGGNPLAGFWQSIEAVAWRRYHRQPRTTSYGIEDFDYYPKGTTAFLAPRDLLREAFAAFVPTIEDMTLVNDDTAVLRWIAHRSRFNISPEFGCVYNARSDMRSFLSHAAHRGTVFVDGHLRPGTRFNLPARAVLAGSPVAILLFLAHPIRGAAIALAGSVMAGAAAYALGARREGAAVLGGLAVPFGIAYLAGMWRGVFLRWRRRPASARGLAASTTVARP
jgi:glycosyltransferase involved in cell wall biosynthesis